MSIGVLALQGNYQAHHKRLVELGCAPLFVKHSRELAALKGLVIPGGESTTMLKLLDTGFRTELFEQIQGGLNVLATCAGVVLLAQRVSNPAQDSLDLLDVDISRNAYGRQLESFVDNALGWTEKGFDLLGSAAAFTENSEAVFIRAPKITRVGDKASVLAESRSDPVLVRQDNILAATFHPEMSEKSKAVHQLFLSMCDKK